MNTVIEKAIKFKIAIEMIDYLGNDGIEDLPYNIECPIGYAKLINNKETMKEINNSYEKYGFDGTDMIPNQVMTVATMLVLEKYFDEDFVHSPFTIQQFSTALKILELDVFDVLEMKYIFNM